MFAIGCLKKSFSKMYFKNLLFKKKKMFLPQKKKKKNISVPKKIKRFKKTSF